MPHIKLPHFYISPSWWSIGDLLDGVIPSLGIDWYAKGGVFNKPSVIGVGEKGPEAVVPLGKLWQRIDRLVAAIEEKEEELPDINLTVISKIDGKETSRDIQRIVTREQVSKARARGAYA